MRRPWWRARACAEMSEAGVLGFGAGDSGTRRLMDGWSSPEPGFCWSVGTSSSLRFPVHDGAGDAVLELSINPFREPNGPPRRLRVSVNGVRIGEDALHGEGIVAYPLPPGATHPGEDATLTLETDPARSLAELGAGDDTRKLGFMLFDLRVIRVPPRPRADATALPPLPDDMDAQAFLPALIGLSPRDLTLCFESLGHNCEFGMLQRRVGAEPIGLLRFAGITMNNLVSGLRRGFAGVGGEVAVRTHPTRSGRLEYIVYDDRYGIGLHSFSTTEDAEAEAVRAEHQQRLQFASRRFANVLASGERLFVFQRHGQITRSQALVVLNLLAGFGPNALLYVDTEPGLPSGAVEQVGYGLYHGRLEQLAPADDIGDLDLPGWLSVCANAYRLWRAKPKP